MCTLYCQIGKHYFQILGSGIDAVFYIQALATRRPKTKNTDTRIDTTDTEIDTNSVEGDWCGFTSFALDYKRVKNIFCKAFRVGNSSNLSSSATFISLQ